MKHIKRFIPLLLLCILWVVNNGIYTAKGQQEASLPSVDNALSEGEAISLEECIGLAAKNSFEVKLARLDFLIAETDQSAEEAIYDTILSADISYEKDKRQALSILSPSLKRTNTYSLEATKKLPSSTELTISLSDTREWSDSSYVSSNPAHTAEGTLELRQPLGKNIFGYIDRRSISITSLAIQNADLDTKERIETLLANVEAAYWEWAFCKEGLEIYRQILEKAKNLHQTNARNYDIGRIEKGDFLASGANVLIREKDVQLADNNYRRAEERIKLLMNIEPSERIYPQESLEYQKREINLEDCLNEAFQKRRDYLNAKREVEMKQLVLETKTNARWPEIDLVASLVANGIDREFGRAINNITTDDNTKYYAGLEISIPIENNLAQSEFEKAGHNKEKALIRLKSIERSIVTKIGDAFRDYITYNTNFNTITEAAKLQHEKLKEEEKRFKYGRSNTKRLIDYQQDYLKSQLEVSKSLVDLEVARINLEKVMNVVLERYKGLL